MIGSFIFAEIDLWITFFISLFVVWSFYKTVNGKLRKLMIIYFLVVAFTHGGAATFWLAQRYNWFYLNPDIYRIIITLPKTIVMLMLYGYLRSLKVHNHLK